MKDNKSFLKNVNNRFLPLPKSAVEQLEHEPKKEDFDFIKELGVGSFATVYLAAHKKTKVKYAIKYIDKDDLDNIKEQANFNREIEIMYKLNHPNIVKLYGHFEDNQYCYFIMQYIPKRSVYELIPKSQQKPNLKLIASVMKDLISAVYYLHNMKPIIIHRDIKPENILLDENHKAYLTDFGWSNYKNKYRRRNTICGTPLYLPPEMAQNLGHDETVDIWCIGVLLFELITGKTPFEGKDFEDVLVNICSLSIQWPPGMDPDAKDLISKILKLNSKERLSIEQILSHKFFTKYYPNAINELIKPDNQQSRTFVVSTDDPKTFEQHNKQTFIGSNNNHSHPIAHANTNIISRKNNHKENNVTFSKVNNDEKHKRNLNLSNRKDEDNKNKTVIIPRINIDLSERVKHSKNHSYLMNTSDKSFIKRSNNNSNKNLMKKIYGQDYKDDIVNRSYNIEKHSDQIRPISKKCVIHTKANSIIHNSNNNQINNSNNSSHIHQKSYNNYQSNNNHNNTHQNNNNNCQTNNSQFSKTSNHTFYNSKNNGITYKHD